MSFRVFVCVLPCCAFSSVGCTASPQFYHSLFFLPYILDIRSFFFLILIPFSQLHSFFHTLHIPLLSSLLFLLLFLSSSMLFGIDHTIHFLLVSQEGILVPDFCRSIPPCLHILYSPHILLPSPLLSILSLAGVYLGGTYFPLHNIPASFST